MVAHEFGGKSSLAISTPDFAAIFEQRRHFAGGTSQWCGTNHHTLARIVVTELNESPQQSSVRARRRPRRRNAPAFADAVSSRDANERTESTEDTPLRGVDLARDRSAIEEHLFGHHRDHGVITRKVKVTTLVNVRNSPK